MTDTKNVDTEIPPPVWDPDLVMSFVRGDASLQEIEGLSEKAMMDAAELGFRYLKNGKLSDAREVFMGLIALNPVHPYFHLAMGSVEQQEKNLEAAEERYGRAIELSPDLAGAYANRGEVRLALGNGIDGLFDLEKAVQLDPELQEDSTKRANVIYSMLKAGLEEQGEDLEEARANYHADDRPWPTDEEQQAREDEDKEGWAEVEEADELDSNRPRPTRGIPRK
ncbi:MAG: tetratricopeptide repeat protein [Deltaproteobacteria bacterium]|nr:tetratricopeptide repeat protein [Deltaproteobacteria bacterium]